MQRRDFIRLLAIAAAAGAGLRTGASEAQAASELYDLPAFGNLSLLHLTDAHAQLLPVYFREPSVNIGVGEAAGQPPHLVGEALLARFGIRPGGAAAHAFTCLDFEAAARRYGKVADPCQVSPPSSSSAAGRLARMRLTSVARCAKPPTFP